MDVKPSPSYGVCASENIDICNNSLNIVKIVLQNQFLVSALFKMLY